jgi:ATP-dependent Clp protease protease subunit
MTSKKKKIKEEEEILETKKVQDDDQDDEKGDDNKVNLQFIPFGNPEDDEIINKVMFYGPVNEKTSSDFIANLITLHDRLDEGEEIEVYLSTSGGNTDDMFAIIDLMNIIKKDRDIKIICIGKTMSAGVLLACSGTKKKRFSTKNTRFMIHEVVFDSGGGSTSYNNHEFNEARCIQDMYVKSIAANTKLTEKKILKLIEGGHHHYFTAEEAKKYGIIDEIIGE